MAFEDPQVVRLRNPKQKVHKDQYANVKYSIPAGGEIVVPWNAATLWLGDPRILDDEARGHFARAEELNRVLTRMGSGGLDGRGLSEPERAAADHPGIEVYDIDGNRIEMLLDDPEGENVTPASFVRAEKDDLLTELDKVKAYQAQLLTLIEQQQNDKTSPGLESAPDDSPSKVPAGPVTTQ